MINTELDSSNTMWEENLEGSENCNAKKMSSEEFGKFPKGMRVLLVDDDVVSLTFISDLLIKCFYQVTRKQNSCEAVALLAQNEENFDIVLTNVNMKEEEDQGFNLVEAGHKLDIPVIMMSNSDNKDMIMKGIRHGARDFLLKPLRIEEIKNIWQHVYRKYLSFMSLTKEACRVDQQVRDPSGGKRERLRWTQDLHDRFVDAVQKLGGADKALPKRILDMMGCHDFMTRENVASHLQKYRKATIKKKIIEVGKNKNLLQQYQPYPRFLPPTPTPVSNGDVKLVGSTMRGVFSGPTMAGSNWSGQLANVGTGYAHPTQILSNHPMMQQSRMQLDGKRGAIGANNSLLTQFVHQHYHCQLQHQLQQSASQQHYLDVKVPDHGLDDSFVFDLSYDQLLYEICPSLLDNNGL